MKKSLLLVALLLTAPVFADEAKADVAQPLTLASADTSVSTNLKATESTDLAVNVEKEIKEVSESLSAKIEAELTKIAQEVTASVKF